MTHATQSPPTHTPTPWQTDESHFFDDGMQHYQDLDYLEIVGSGTVALVLDLHSNHEDTKANAAHIVKCVNMHDELVEALEYITKSFPVSEFGDVKKHFSKLNALATASKALHKARE